MLAKVIIENGVKKIQALTADTGTGAPVGSYLYLEKKSNPQGYLFCDGSTFDETVYPALYQYLGTNVLPDWRELGAKGAEKNTTLIFDSTETDPSTGQAGTQDHDVFTQGEFKDDQLQNHTHGVLANSEPNGTSFIAGSTGNGTNGNPATQNGSGRMGTVTRGKSRAVFIYIKATSGLTENQQENVLNTINENNSYSTEEHPTGKKWIDGKDIYRKCGYVSSISSVPYIVDSVLTDSYIDVLIESKASMRYYASKIVVYGYSSATDRFSLNVMSSGLTLITNFSLSDIANGFYWTVEYTKTTD